MEEDSLRGGCVGASPSQRGNELLCTRVMGGSDSLLWFEIEYALIEGGRNCSALYMSKIHRRDLKVPFTLLAYHSLSLRSV